MKMACVRALADLARLEASHVAVAAYGDKPLKFGPQYLIPKPFDPRLLVQLAPAVAEAAMSSGVATRRIENLGEYREKLARFQWRTGLLMKPVYDAARKDLQRVALAEGENEVILRAVQTMLDDGVADPVLIGRPAVIRKRIEKLGLRMKPDEDFEIVNPEYDPRFWDYWTSYLALMERKGVYAETAKITVRTNATVIGALMVHRGDADALIAGVVGRFHDSLQDVMDVIGLRPGGKVAGTLGALNTTDGTYFICDTHVNPNPSAEELAEITLMAADKVRVFGLEPRVALLSHSSFGSHDNVPAAKMRRALELIIQQAPDLQVDGEMTADMALDYPFRRRVFPNSRFRGPANLLVMPGLDSAHISFNLSRIVSNSVTVGPILLGMARPVHILSPSATVRRVVNMTAVAAVEAQQLESARNTSDE